MSAKSDVDGPSAKVLDTDGYNQTYVILKDGAAGKDTKRSSDGLEVLFRCGNWCYMGRIQFGNLVMGLTDLPVIIPTLQKQQGSLRYYCNASRSVCILNFILLHTHEIS